MYGPTELILHGLDYEFIGCATDALETAFMFIFRDIFTNKFKYVSKLIKK